VLPIKEKTSSPEQAGSLFIANNNNMKGLVTLPGKMNVGVLFGGRSGEHDISLLSAASVMQAMDPQKYHVVPIGITEDGRWLAGGDPLKALREKKIPGDCSPAVLITDPSAPGVLLTEKNASGEKDSFQPLDLIFPLLHGPYGEDGTVQGLFELAGLPYAGAGVLASAVGMDKEFMKILFQHHGLDVGEYLAFQLWHWEEEEEALIREIEETLGYPCFIKPANMGSSVGISKAFDREMLRKGVNEAFAFDLKVIVEAYIQGGELACGVLGGEENPIASLPGEIIPCNDFYDYQAKYLDDRSRLVIPAPLDEDALTLVQDWTKKAFLAVGCSGLGRVDFFYQRDEKRLIINEINTLPGFTAVSLYPKLWAASGIPYGDLIDRLIEIALARFNRKKGLRVSPHE
jgi:D-alanine-D-alanine ligase